MGGMHTPPQHAVISPGLGRYRIDPGRSAVRFRTRHLFGLAPVTGTFEIRSGTVELTEPLASSAVRVEIAAGSFHTGNRPRDRAVAARRFLDTARHPVITFTADQAGRETVTGTLTAHGVTKPVSLAIEHAEVTGRSFTVRASTRIDRTEFGVTASRGLAGRYLSFTLEIRCVRD
jgi:polyisoprenoid-binding protein YceI